MKTFVINEDILSYLLQVLDKHTTDQPIKQSELVNTVISKFDIPFTDRYLRHYINHIRTEGLELLGANSKGFFVIKDAEALKKYAARLTSQYTAFKKMLEGQLLAAKRKTALLTPKQ